MAGLTELTAEQRAAALEKAVEARRARSELKRKIKAGELGVEEALAAPEAQRMRVAEFLGAWPGIGAAKVAAFMSAAGVSQNRRVKGLGKVQREKLVGYVKQVLS